MGVNVTCPTDLQVRRWRGIEGWVAASSVVAMTWPASGTISGLAACGIVTARGAARISTVVGEPHAGHSQRDRF